MLLSPLIVYITTHCLTVANIGSFFVTAKGITQLFFCETQKLPFVFCFNLTFVNELFKTI